MNKNVVVSRYGQVFTRLVGSLVYHVFVELHFLVWWKTQRLSEGGILPGALVPSGAASLLLHVWCFSATGLIRDAAVEPAVFKG